MSISTNLDGVTQLGSWTFTLTSLPPNAAQETGGALAGLYANEQTNIVPLLQQILVELRVVTAVLVSGLNVQDDPDRYRNDPTFSQVN